MEEIDVLCAGFACYDLVFGVARHPGPDEKVFAECFFACGGGPAANAAGAAARLGAVCAFAGYLGDDLYGRRHLAELAESGVRTELVVTGADPTPLSAIVVKADGRRTVINYKGGAGRPLAAGAVAFESLRPRVVLFDGHQPQLSRALLAHTRRCGSATVLDAGSLHEGTRQLAGEVDYLVASEKFARQLTGSPDPLAALARLQRPGAAAVVTLGEQGLAWRTDDGCGRMEAFPVKAVDTTGAGDTFHGAFAAGLAAGRPFLELLRYASAAAALCCTAFGARAGIPEAGRVEALLAGGQARPLPAEAPKEAP